MALVEHIIDRGVTAEYDGGSWDIVAKQVIPAADLSASPTMGAAYAIAESLTPDVGSPFDELGFIEASLLRKKFGYLTADNNGHLNDLEVTLIYRGGGGLPRISTTSTTTHVETGFDRAGVPIVTTDQGNSMSHVLQRYDAQDTLQVESFFSASNSPLGTGWGHPFKVREAYRLTTNALPVDSLLPADTTGQFLITNIALNNFNGLPYTDPETLLQDYRFTLLFEIQRNTAGWDGTAVHERIHKNDDDEPTSLRPIANPINDGGLNQQIVHPEFYFPADWSNLPWWLYV